MIKKTFLSFFLFILLFSSSVCAIGIAPNRVGYINFEPNLEIEATIHVYNSYNFPFPVEMELGGDLAEYAELSEYEFVLAADSDKDNFVKTLTLTAKLPEKLEEPGEHILKIHAMQASVGEVVGGLSAREVVATGLFVFVPYPGKYIETDFTIENARVNETIVFKISVSHRGNVTIDDIRALIELYDSSGKMIGIMKTNNERLDPGQIKTVGVEWPAINVKPGNYKANAILTYDGIKEEIKKDFRIGSPTIIITDVTADPIVNGTPGKIVTKISSMWDENIPNVFVRAHITRGRYSASVTSPSKTIGPFKDAEFEMYWDTAEAVGPGDYLVNVTAYYFNGTNSKETTLKVIGRGGFNLLWIAVLVLIIVAVIAAIFYLKKRKHKNVQKRLV